MGDFVELRPLAQPRRVCELAPEAQRFKSFKVLATQKEDRRVVDLAFCPAAPYRLAVASSTKVGLWSQKGDVFENDGNLSKFKDVTQCVAWRPDGKLMLVGDATGKCSVVEVETKKTLRRLTGHGDAVTRVAFASVDKGRVATGGRDGQLRIWDIATSDLLQTIPAHTDCMKALSPGPGGFDSWVTAGHDRLVKLWDLRCADGEGGSACVASADHGHPIEAGVAFPGCAMYVTAGGPEVKVWDLAGGGRLVQALSDAHSKIVTSVALDSKASVLMTCSFDGLMKVHEVAGLQYLWTYRLPAPAICAAWRPDDNAFVVGLDNDHWQLRQFPVKASGAEAQKKLAGAKSAQPVKVKKQKGKRKMHPQRAPEEVDSDEELVEAKDVWRKKEKKVDFFLRKFEYRKAVEQLTYSGTTASDGFAIVDELLQRGDLAIAFSEIGEELCLSVLRWLSRVFSVGDTFQQNLLFEALHTLLDSNRCLNPPSTQELVHAILSIENAINKELAVQSAVTETCGMLEAIHA